MEIVLTANKGMQVEAVGLTYDKTNDTMKVYWYMQMK